MFSGLAINAVSRAAGSVIFEVRRQFREKPGIMAGTELPDYSRVVDIVTKDSLRELTTPGLLAILTPIAVGFGLGIGALGSFLAGTIATGTLMAVFLSNSGGAWDNAKKFVEDGHFGGKGSEAHSATVIGDTVGDPFKERFNSLPVEQRQSLMQQMREAKEAGRPFSLNNELARIATREKLASAAVQNNIGDIACIRISTRQSSCCVGAVYGGVNNIVSASGVCACCASGACVNGACVASECAVNACVVKSDFRDNDIRNNICRDTRAICA
jgi:uncharacterized membrane protein